MSSAVHRGRENSGSRAALERRACVRYPCDLGGSCKPVIAPGSSQSWLAQVENISRGGVRLVVPRRFEAGTMLQIDFPAGPDRPATTMLVRVQYVARKEDGAWALGCAFGRLLSEDDVRAVADHT